MAIEKLFLYFALICQAVFRPKLYQRVLLQPRQARRVFRTWLSGRKRLPITSGGTIPP
jgi:hypothetical protein